MDHKDFKLHKNCKQHCSINQRYVVAYPSSFLSLNQHESKLQYCSFQGYLSFNIRLIDCEYRLYHIYVRNFFNNLKLKVRQIDTTDCRSCLV